MLPEKAGSIILDKESRRRLDSYYTRFCEGANNRRYGLSHIVYACHVSFPMVITPEMANLVWLNFRSYPVRGDSVGIDRVVVSDFLLSPLVRTVAAGQFEIIPAIRNYLLYLLRNGEWFSLFGIGPFGDQRITDLAIFLEQYLQRKKDTDEASSMFRQANEWAAKAYLNPDDLAVKMATALNETFDTKTSKRNDEYQQLYINTLVNRFGEQLESGIHAETVKSKQAFINLQLYSNANNALLFGKPEEADAILMKLGKAFLAQSGGTTSLVDLPLGKTVGERLERKKNNVQKVRSLLIGKEGDNLSDSKDTRPGFGVKKIKELLHVMDNGRGYDTGEQQHVSHLASKSTILAAVSSLISAAEPEDICFIYFAGNRSFDNSGSPNVYMMKNIDERGDAISKMELTNAIYNAPGAKGSQLVLFLDIDGSPDESWLIGDSILMYLTRPADMLQWNNTADITTTAFSVALEGALRATNYKITYGDLQRYMEYAMEEVFQQPGFGVMLHASRWLQNSYFLSYEERQKDNRYVIVFNPRRDSWQVLEEDFTLTPVNIQTYVYNYSDGAPVKDVRGEMFRRDGIVLFNGLKDALLPTFIYKAEAVRPALAYDIILSPGTVPMEGYIANTYAESRFDKFSKWSTLRLSNIWRDFDSYKENTVAKNEGFLLLYMREKDGEIKYQLSVQEPIMQKQHSIFQAVDLPGLENLSANTEKLMRFFYLLFLEHHTDLTGNVSTFQVMVDISWDFSPATSYSFQGTFEIEEAAFEFTNEGELTICPFRISMQNNESFPLYFDVYLMFPDLTIYQFERETEILPGNIRGSVTLDDPNMLKKVVDAGYGIFIKVLLSRRPMQIDFSQQGVY